MSRGSGAFVVWRHDLPSNEESGKAAGSRGSVPTHHSMQMAPAVYRTACWSLKKH